ncbi:unnamed protein product [Ilex paraguariensis]|uniref:Uncharacterized protein n=1 Tax=Ilex paraguariensis TaxID=185542 RepID=A0ABC8RHQ3_9AQUA
MKDTSWWLSQEAVLQHYKDSEDQLHEKLGEIRQEEEIPPNSDVTQERTSTVSNGELEHHKGDQPENGSSNLKYVNIVLERKKKT